MLKEVEDAVAEDSSEPELFGIEVSVLEVADWTVNELLEDTVKEEFPNPKAYSPPPRQLPPHMPLSKLNVTWKTPPALVPLKVTPLRGRPLTKS
jgi:hypothetical protein